MQNPKNREEILKTLARQVVELSMRQRWIAAERDRLLNDAAQLRELAKTKANPEPCFKAAAHLESRALALVS